MRNLRVTDIFKQRRCAVSVVMLELNEEIYKVINCSCVMLGLITEQEIN